MAASFCSNKPDVGWGRIEKKLLITLVGGWINFQFLLPWRCLQRFCYSFSLLFFLTRLPCNQQRDARLLFSLSIHYSIIFLTFCDSLIQVLQFNSSFPFCLWWDIYLFLPFLQVVKAKKGSFPKPLRCSMLGN